MSCGVERVLLCVCVMCGLPERGLCILPGFESGVGGDLVVPGRLFALSFAVSPGSLWELVPGRHDPGTLACTSRGYSLV